VLRQAVQFLSREALQVLLGRKGSLQTALAKVNGSNQLTYQMWRGNPAAFVALKFDAGFVAFTFPLVWSQHFLAYIKISGFAN
jgi:hypothetical protein